MNHIDRQSFEGEFFRVATPVLTSYVYEQARLVNTGDFVLLAGPAATFVGEEFVGRGEVPTVRPDCDRVHSSRGIRQGTLGRGHAAAAVAGGIRGRTVRVGEETRRIGVAIGSARNQKRSIVPMQNQGKAARAVTHLQKLILAAAVAVHATPIPASLIINLTFDDTNAPADGSAILGGATRAQARAVVEAAVAYWTSAFAGSRSAASWASGGSISQAIEVAWGAQAGDTLATGGTGWAGDGSFTSGFLTLDNDGSSLFFVDPSPFDNSPWRQSSARSVTVDGVSLNLERVYFDAPSGSAREKEDLLSVAIHEIGHALGIGVTFPGFDANVVDSDFIVSGGPYDGFSIPLSGSHTDFFLETPNGQFPYDASPAAFPPFDYSPNAMGASLLAGVRKLPAAVDFALLANTLGFDPATVNYSGVPTGIVMDVPSGTQTQAQAGFPSIDAALSVTKTGGGTVVFDVANAYTGPTTIAAGTLRVAAANGLASSSVTVDTGATLAVAAGTTMRSPSVIIAGGTLSGASIAVDASTGISALAIHAGTIAGSPTVAITAGGGMALAPDARVTVSVGGLSVDQTEGGGRLDLGAGQVSIAAGGISAADLRADIIAGRNGGGWNGGTGIMSSTAASSGGTRGVGYVVAGDGSAKVSYAAAGDVDLSGAVNVFDLVSINSSGKYGAGTASVWDQGDFNYDGVTNVFDLVGVNTAGSYGQGNYFPAGPSAAGIGPAAGVPEPEAGLLVAVGLAAGAAGWRRRPA